MSTDNPKEATTDSRTLDEFMSSLQRLFKIAIYYPSGHTILDQATARFMDLLKLIAGDELTVTLENLDDALMLDGVKFDPRLPFVEEFSAVLDGLDIASITFDREITAQEIHSFVKKILQFKARSANAKQFVRIDVSDLPHSTRVIQREYIVRSSGLASSTSSDPSDNLNVFIDSLTKYGLDSQQITNCRVLLESLPQRLPDASIDLSDLPHASWDDVALLLARMVKDREGAVNEGKRKLSTHHNINALASILKKLESTTKDRKSRQTINLLISIIKNPLEKKGDRAEFVSQAPTRVFAETPQFSIAQIQQYCDTNAYTSSILETIPDAPTNNETLSILMQLARYDQPLQTQIRMQQLIREQLAEAIGEKTWEILSKGLEEIVRERSAPKIKTIIGQLLDPLRKKGGDGPLKLFFLTLKACHPDERRILWPYVVNELLITGSRPDKQLYHQLAQFAASMPQETMEHYLPQLQVLESFQERNIAADIFHAVTPPCYPLFGFLLRTELKLYIGERVIGGIRKDPKNELIKAVVPLLDLNNEEHILFLHAFLYQPLRKDGADRIRAAAGHLISSALEILPQERRNESWIPNTIAALGSLPSPETRSLLEQIGSRKKLLFIPEWPATCRKAAEETLAKMGRR